MEIKDLLVTYQTTHQHTYQKSERAEIVKKFVDRLNADRISSGYKPLKASVYAIKMAQSGLKTNSDLYWFYRYCEDAKNFSKCWWWSLKPNKNNDE